jgi:cytochrome c oxidase subunit II
MRRLLSVMPPVIAVGMLAACTGTSRQSVLDPRGERAEAVEGLWLLMLVIGVIVWVAVVVVLAVGVARRRRSGTTTEARDGSAADERERPADDGRSHGDGDGDEQRPADDPAVTHERAGARRPLWVVAIAGAIVPAVVISVLVVVSAGATRAVDPGRVEGDPLVEVVGHQYWWEVHYPGSGVVTANEVHIPTGERVRVSLTTEDVIHSFWVPTLSGKVDMIPGRANALWLQTDEPGVYWGQCAEFCGTQHAMMRFVVVAHEPAEFAGWLEAQAEPAQALPEPEEDPVIARGREVFLSSSCVYCHTIEGTSAQGDVGPDLTHLAGRRSIAAGTLPNERGELAGWILDPQALKPGSGMPGTDIQGDELQALLAYLESLE